MTPDHAPGAPSYAGHNRITTDALTSTARAVAAEVLGVQAAQVRASFSDDRGLLALLLSLPLPVPALTRVVQDPRVLEAFGGPLWVRADAARTPILQRVQHLTGARLSRVDIRIIGSTVTKGARVL
ncbi:hypothetical protein PTW37_01350 [Arthrobacter agilis]|uniref:hypothetical protein n=1 Tax=Arthrobacter agilis TaxID=37921 RepID=UPI002366224F|nr:hypothetical protein [Arthrobacter agilis]WDF33609.1 hypothetical protein PTW37_01350 [Arthrobacter agilis]